MTIVAAATSVKTTVVPNVEHAETILICGPMDQVRHIALGGKNIQRKVRIVEAWDMWKAGPLNLANPGSASYARQVKQII